MADAAGTNPVALRRRHLGVLSNSEYLVSEKTDGVRYLLVCTGVQEAVLVNRKVELFTVGGLNTVSEGELLSIGIAQAASLSTGTVLDGELVLNRSSRATARLLVSCSCCLIVTVSLLIATISLRQCHYLSTSFTVYLCATLTG